MAMPIATRATPSWIVSGVWHGRTEFRARQDVFERAAARQEFAFNLTSGAKSDAPRDAEMKGPARDLSHRVCGDARGAKFSVGHL